jgi:uracil-DNA glycosylase
MNKILIIGQAPAKQEQQVPYDTTLLYTMLEWVGISKDKAQDIFEFEAVSNVFPGSNEIGHLKPSKEAMDRHWNETLEMKVQCADKVWLLGNVAKEYFYSKPKTYSCNLEILETCHPSKRNYSRIMSDKEKLSSAIKEFVCQPSNN